MKWRGCGAKQKGVTVSSNPLKSGGEGEIRTPGTLLTYTRFPIVLLRPARTPLHSVIVHRSKPNICIAASKELQAKKSNMGRLLQIFWSAGYHRMAKACGQEGLGKVAWWMFAALVAPSCRAANAVLRLSCCIWRAVLAVLPGCAALAVCRKLGQTRPAQRMPGGPCSTIKPVC